MDPTKLGDTSSGVWLAEVMNDCPRYLPNNRVAVDMSLLVNKCRAEPKNAQFAMQLLAEDLQRMLGGRSVEDPPEEAKIFRLVLGSLLSAYCVARHLDDGHSLDEYPQELEGLLRRYPLIVECVDFVSKDNAT